MTDPTSPRRPTRRMRQHIPIDALDPLPQHLLKSSRQLCEQALVTFTEGDWSAFYLNAGFSLEHALKAVLAALHPTLIADPRDFDSMHMLARGPINLPHVAPSLRTIAFQQSVSNAVKVAPNLAKLESDIRALARHRNAVAHVGATTSSTTDRDVKTFLTAVLTVVVHLEVDVAEFFGEFTGFMQTQLDEQAADEQREVKALIATAQVHRERQYTEGFPSQHYGASIHSAEWARGDEFQPFECPVCRIDAVMEGALAVDVEVDVEMVDGEYVPTYALRVVAVMMPSSTCSTSSTSVHHRRYAESVIAGVSSTSWSRSYAATFSASASSAPCRVGAVALSVVLAPRGPMDRRARHEPFARRVTVPSPDPRRRVGMRIPISCDHRCDHSVRMACRERRTCWSAA